MTTETAPSTSAKPFHYYDWHLTNEDLMGESAIQDYLLAYLVAILRHLLAGQPAFVARNLTTPNV